MATQIEKKNAFERNRKYMRQLYNQMKKNSEFKTVSHAMRYSQLTFMYNGLYGKLARDVEPPYTLFLFWNKDSKDGVHKFYKQNPKLSEIISILNNYTY